MLSSRRLRQLFELAVSHPDYFLHNYRKELANAGYEEITIDDAPKPIKAVAKGHGKKVLSGASFLAKGRPIPEGSDPFDAGIGLKDG